MIEKRYVTRKRLWNHCGFVWGIWDKQTCSWYQNEGWIYRNQALIIADKLNAKKN